MKIISNNAKAMTLQRYKIHLKQEQFQDNQVHNLQNSLLFKTKQTNLTNEYDNAALNFKAIRKQTVFRIESIISLSKRKNFRICHRISLTLSNLDFVLKVLVLDIFNKRRICQTPQSNNNSQKNRWSSGQVIHLEKTQRYQTSQSDMSSIDLVNRHRYHNFTSLRNLLINQ